jgi:hypothetical protein
MKKPVKRNMGGMAGRPTGRPTALPAQAMAGRANAAPQAAAGLARAPFKKGGKAKKGKH